MQALIYLHSLGVDRYEKALLLDSLVCMYLVWGVGGIRCKVKQCSVPTGGVKDLLVDMVYLLSGKQALQAVVGSTAAGRQVGCKLLL